MRKIIFFTLVCGLASFGSEFIYLYILDQPASEGSQNQNENNDPPVVASGEYPEPDYFAPTASFPGIAYNPPVSNYTPNASTPEISEYTQIGFAGDVIALASDGTDDDFVLYAPGYTNQLTAMENNDPMKGLELSSGIPDSMYLLWPTNSNGYGEPVAINKTDAWWIGSDKGTSKAVANTTVSVYGKSLDLSGSSYLYIEETDTWLTNSTANPYRADFVLPAGTTNGTYTVYAHNGVGGKYGFSDALSLTVESALTFGGTVYNVTASPYNAVPNDGNADQQAFLDAISDMSAGDSLYVPAGTYHFSDRVYWGLSGCRMYGDGTNQTIITSTASGHAFSNEEGLFHAAWYDSVIEDITFDIGPVGSKVRALRLQGCDGLVIRNCEFTDLGSPSNNNTIDLRSSDNVLFENNRVVTYAGILLTNMDGIVLRNNKFYGRGGNECGYLFSLSGTINPSVTGNTGEALDDSDYTDGEGWTQGRFMVASGANFRSAREFYISGNETFDLVPRFNYDGDPYSGQDNQNTGEQILFESSRAQERSLATAATSNTVTLASLTADRSSNMLSIIGGTGQGQSRLVTACDTGTGLVTVNRPWSVEPSTDSVVVIGTFANRIAIYDNTFDGTPRMYDANDLRYTSSGGVSMYMGSSECVIDKNVITETRAALYEWTILHDLASVGKAVVEPALFNLYQNNLITNCVFGLQVGMLRSTGSTNQADNGVMATVFRDNHIENATDYAFNVSEAFPEIVVDLTVFDGNTANGVSNHWNTTVTGSNTITNNNLVTVY